LDKKKDTEEYLQAVAHGLDKIFNGDKRGNARPTGFVLLIYPFAEFDNGDARCNYVSNGADRKDVVVLMKEMIARFEGQPYTEGNA
jgi:hypothetical protein